MNLEQTIDYIITYLGIPEELQAYATSIIKGAYPFYDSTMSLVDHVRESIKVDLEQLKKREEANSQQ